MNIPLPMLERAFAAHFGPDLSSRLALAFNAIQARRARGSTGDGTVVPDDQVGDLLAEAVAPGVGLIAARTPITSAKIIFGETLLETVVAADVTGPFVGRGEPRPASATIGETLPRLLGEDAVHRPPGAAGRTAQEDARQARFFGNELQKPPPVPAAFLVSNPQVPWELVEASCFTGHHKTNGHNGDTRAARTLTTAVRAPAGWMARLVGPLALVADAVALRTLKPLRETDADQRPFSISVFLWIAYRRKSEARPGWLG